MSYPFGNFANRVVGLTVFFDPLANSLQAVRTKRTKVGAVFTSDPAEPEAPRPIVGAFTFDLEIPVANETGLLAIEPGGWGPVHYDAPVVILLGSDRPFAGNGNEAFTVPNAVTPLSHANRRISFTFTPAATPLGSQLTWSNPLGGSTGSAKLTAANTALIVALRLSGPGRGLLHCGAASPWGAGSIGW